MDLDNTLPHLVAKPMAAVFCDTEMGTCFHEVGHCMVLLQHERLPDRVTLDPPAVHHKNLGRVDPYFLMALHMSGTAGAALYSGQYHWSNGDAEHLERTVRRNRILSHELIRVWKETHVLLLDHWDLVSLMASKLYREKEIDKSYFKMILSWND